MPPQMLVSDDRSPLGAPIEQISVEGFKSIGERQTMGVKPLTLLAGANSSGKSSMLQPLLLLKQTLEASYDPGALRLDGPNVNFTSSRQLLSRSGLANPLNSFEISLSLGDRGAAMLRLVSVPSDVFRIGRQVTTGQGQYLELTPESTPDDLLPFLAQGLGRPPTIAETQEFHERVSIEQDRCFLRIWGLRGTVGEVAGTRTRMLPSVDLIAESIRAVIHVPGLRGRPERTYPRTAYDKFFAGVFDPYVATVVLEWLRRGDRERLRALNQDLQDLGLAAFVDAVTPNDVDVELHVGRLPVRSGRSSPAAVAPRSTTDEDRVSLADVGFGVSQTLPVVVALYAARPGQLVYIEQPELHLHPRAQVAMSRVLARAANRGVRVVAETHSSLILRGIQTAVAQELIPSEQVALHWFERDDARGATRITSAQPDREGAFGDWPEDFDDVILTSESDYLDAVEYRERRAC